MNTESDDSKNIRLYESLLSQHGDSFKSLNWGSRESQIRRFEVLAEVGIKSGDSVLDVGCGLGDFYAWIQQNTPGVQYFGIDITPGMIARARQRHLNTQFEIGAVFDKLSQGVRYDYVIASGIFYYRQREPEEYMYRVIDAMFSLARKGVAFNCLSSWTDYKEPLEFYADPIKTFSFCRNVTSFLGLRHDYHGADFTIYLRRI
jgi:SAM-dependent methyltransferase